MLGFGDDFLRGDSQVEDGDMKLEILGCSGDVTGGRRTTAYLVDDRVLFDAGTVTDVLAPARSRQISHVFLSHIHLDHVKGLCFLSEELSMEGDRSIAVLGDGRVIEALSLHVFNNALWPNFTCLEDKEHPIVRTQAMEALVYTAAHELRVKAVPVNHRIPTTGFIIKEGEETVILTSDTGVTGELWEMARKENNLKFIVAHVAFPDRLSSLAQRAGHMTPSVLFDRIDTFRLHHVPFYVAHMKSMFEEEIRDELAKAGRKNICPAEQGSILVG